MTSGRRVAHRYRLMLSMSLADAKVTLGFPPDANPSSSEVAKAWREMAFKFHPDRGGDPDKMVEINVAKDILEGKQRPSGGSDPWSGSGGRPAGPARPRGRDEEVSFDEAKNKAGIPGGVTWQFVTDDIRSGYSSDEMERRAMGFVAYGITDSKHVFVAAEHLRKADYYIGGGPSQDLWSIKSFEYPRKEGEALAPAWLYGNVVKAVKSFQWVTGKFNSKVVSADGWKLSERTPHGKSISIKHWLVNSGLVAEDDPSVAGRKNVVEIQFKKAGFGTDEKHGIELTINGRTYPLSERDVSKFTANYEKVLRFIFGTYYYDGSRKVLTRMPAVKKKKIFEWMLKVLQDLPTEVSKVLEVEVAR